MILLAFVSVLAACASPTEKKPYDGPTIWPQPPDQPRFAYETMLRSTADIAKVSEEESLRERLTGVPAVSNKPVLDKPSAIVARRGRIFVVDSGSHSIVVFDVPRRKVFRFGIREPGNLSKPAGLALDNEMNVYVVDAARRIVLVYDSLGLFQHVVGNPADLERPTGVAVSQDGERIYVIDRAHNESEQHRVVVYDKAGKKLQEIGSRGGEGGQFNVPTQGTVGADGTLYVLDAGNFRVQAFDRDGKYLHSFGGAGKEFGRFARPRGIAADDEGNIYVSDAGFNNFQIFNPGGELLLAIGQGGKESNPGRYGMLNGIAVDETGRVYVVDQLFNKIEVLRRLSDSEGQELLLKESKK
jgi:DNA-binding beta-propeller fold protein YncE